MFVIKNLTNTDIVLDDLRVVLGRQKELDLDKVAPRHQSDQSHKLRALVHNHKIKILRKDLELLLGDEQGDTKPSLDGTALYDMEARLKKEFAKQQRAKDAKIGELTEAVQLLVKKLGEQPPPTVIIQQQLPATPEKTRINSVKDESHFVEKDASTAGDISDDIASRLHAKAVKKMEKKVVGHVEHSEERIEDSTLQKNIDELEGLL